MKALVSFIFFFLSCLTSTKAQTPSQAASNIKITQVGCDEMTITWNNGNGVGRIVVIQENQQISGIPTDNKFYIPNNNFGQGDSLESHSAFVVYNGTSNTTKISKLKHNTRYFIKVFEFNGAGSIFWYKTDNVPEADSITFLLQADFDIAPSYQCLQGNKSAFLNKSQFNGKTALNYTWNFGNGVTSAQKDTVYSYLNSGIFKIKLSVSSIGCSDEIEKNDTIVAKPEISFKLDPNFIGNDSIQCFPGNQFRFLPKVKFKSLGVSSNQYTWFFGDGRSSGEGRALHEYNDTGTFVVQLIVNGTWNSRDYCADTIDAIYRVTSGPLDSNSISFSDTALCLQGNIFEFENTSPKGGITNTWFFSKSDSFIGNKATWSFRQPGKYAVKLIASENNFCKDTFIDSVEVFDKPNNFFSGLDTFYCQSNDIIKLRPNLDGGYFFGTNTNSVDSSFSLVDTGQYIISYVYTKGDCKDTFTAKTKISPKPSFYFPSDTSICLGDTISIVIENFGSVVWKDDLQDSFRKITKAGEYGLTVFDKLGICQATDSFTLNQIQAPLFNLGKDTVLCSLANYSIGIKTNSDLNNYLWNTGSTSPIINLDNAGNYILTVSNTCGSLTDEINIEVNRNLCAISYPNAFSPNDDGVNDLFQVKGNFSPLSMDIYNRWGQLIYEKERAIWDGFVQEKKTQQGIYYFILIALDRAGRKIQIKDFIYLVD